MSKFNSKSSSVLGGVLALTCMFAAGGVLAQFQRNARARSEARLLTDGSVSAPALESKIAPPPLRLLSAVYTAHYHMPSITPRGDAVIVPITDAGLAFPVASPADLGHWRIVDPQGRTVAYGTVPKNTGQTSTNQGFTVRSTGRIAMLSNLPVKILSVQAADSPARFTVGEYALEQSDCGRGIYGRFSLDAQPTVTVAAIR